MPDWLQNPPAAPKSAAPKSAAPRGGGSSSSGFGIILIMVVVLGAVGTWVIQRNRATAMNAAPAAAASVPKPVPSKPTPAAASPSATAPPTATTTNSKSRSSSSTARAGSKGDAPAVSDPAPAHDAPQPAAALPEVRDQAVPAVADGLFDMSIYGPETPEVAPPSGVYIRWPTMPTEQQVGAIQVVISQNGAVESARPLTNPRTLSEYIVVTAGLSAAKTWRFRPALKDGRPVKYRMIVAPGNRGP